MAFDSNAEIEGHCPNQLREWVGQAGSGESCCSRGGYRLFLCYTLFLCWQGQKKLLTVSCRREMLPEERTGEQLSSQTLCFVWSQLPLVSPTLPIRNAQHPMLFLAHDACAAGLALAAEEARHAPCQQRTSTTSDTQSKVYTTALRSSSVKLAPWLKANKGQQQAAV